ncbi:MAG: chain-length determining protein, partial [Myxococcales bacterium]
MRAIVVPPPPPPEITSEPIVDPAAVRDWISYVREAVRHHALLAIVVFLATAGGAASVPWLLGRTYHVEATLLAQRSQVMPALGNPTRAIPSDADAPTRAAAEIVLRRSNLVALARQTNLLETWEHGRAPLLRLKDRVLALGHRPLEEDEKLDALLGLVEKRLWVHAGEGTVTIAFDWHDPQAAHRLVEAAQENFLE